jgi:hypothetical protein
MSDIKIIYLDLDGVLVNMNYGIRLCLNMGKHEKIENHHVGKVLQREIPNGFFETLPPVPDFQLACETIFRLADNGYDMRVLTALGKRDPVNMNMVAEQKKVWLKTHGLGFLAYRANFSIHSEDKAIFAVPHAILIDDRDKSINPFVAAGGYGILHTNWESTKTQMRFLTRH